MKDKDYSQGSMDNSHYSVPSMYGKLCREQYNMQPKYCEPGKESGRMNSPMKASHSNKQAGA